MAGMRDWAWTREPATRAVSAQKGQRTEAVKADIPRSLKPIAGRSVEGRWPRRAAVLGQPCRIMGGETSPHDPIRAGPSYSAGRSIHTDSIARGLRYLVFVQPPSTTTDWPFTIADPGEHRKAIVAAMSSTSARRG